MTQTTTLRDFPHFKGPNLTRSEKIQRKVVELLLNSTISEDEHDSSPVFELKHSSSCCQVGRILAEKRGLNVELAELICVMHDIYVIVEGKYEDHATRGAPIARKMLEESGDFTEEEINTIVDAIAHHSEKHIKSDNPYAELVKDADATDCSLYEQVEGYYKRHKSPESFLEYEKRIKKVRGELGLQTANIWRNNS
jgi:uncharacterized protein